MALAFCTAHFSYNSNNDFAVTMPNLFAYLITLQILFLETCEQLPYHTAIPKVMVASTIDL